MRINLKLAILILAVVIPALILVFVVSNSAFDKLYEERVEEDYRQTGKLLNNIAMLEGDRLRLLAESVNNDRAPLKTPV